MTGKDWLMLLVAGVLIFVGVRKGGVTPGPPPVPSDKFRVMIIEETEDRNKTAGVINGWKWREYITGKGGEYRLFDDDIAAADLATTPEVWQRMYAKTKEEAKGVTPWVLGTDGRAGVSGPLPATEEALVETLQKIGGK